MLRTPRLTLRAPTVEDGRALAAFHLENAAHLDPWSPPRPAALLTEAGWRERAALFEAEAAAGISSRFLLLADGEIAGVANFTQIFRGPFCRAILGYGLGARHEGRGLMYEALTALLPHVLAAERLHRVEANHLPENERSARLLARLGFVREGYARDYLFIGGRWRDHVLNAYTNPLPMEPG